MNIHRALSDIADMRAQLDRTESFRGFRSTAVAISIVFLGIGVALQAWIIDAANPRADHYLMIWLPVAVASVLVAAVEMVVRGKVSQDEATWRMHRQLAAQVAPALVVGLVLTILIAVHASDSPSKNQNLIWALPGIWGMNYGLGLFACSQRLPRPTIWVALFFVVASVMALIISWPQRDLASWKMLAIFGPGQTALAAILFWKLERNHGSA